MEISANLSMSIAESYPVPADFGHKVDTDYYHLQAIGRLIEANEGQLRNDLFERMIGKQLQILN